MQILPDPDMLNQQGCKFEQWQGNNTPAADLPRNCTPQEITQLIRDRGIIGQTAAVRAASLIVFNHFEKRPSVSLFCGPTGSGKTQIWRVLQREYGNIIIHDASTLSAEGWKGGNKISTIFKSIQPGYRGRVILVLDEADKLIEPQYGSNGSNYSDLVQNQLLKLCDHDTLFFGGGESSPGFSVDCSGVSVVFLGAFSRLIERKSQHPGEIGFGAPLRQECTYDNTEITTEDLISYGMRAELAGRVNRIVNLEPLSVYDMEEIGKRELMRLSVTMRADVDMARDTLAELSRDAVEKGLGARWLKSRMSQMLDDLIYDDPDACEYVLGTFELDAPPEA